jgi:hypothetical protein
VLIPFVFLSVVLSAMQVGIGLDRLESNKTFLNASYGIALFSMICVLTLPAAFVIISVFSYVYNVTQLLQRRNGNNE